jgi:hypothetical protein
VIRQHLRLGRRRLRKAVAQNLGDAPMQRLSPALEKILVGRILNKRVLEAIVGVGWEALDEQNIGLRELSSAVRNTASAMPLSVRRRP